MLNLGVVTFKLSLNNLQIVHLGLTVIILRQISQGQHIIGIYFPKLRN